MGQAIQRSGKLFFSTEYMNIEEPKPPTQDDHEERALLEAVRSGETEAFAGVIRRYQARLYNYLYRFTHNREDCEDLVNDTFFQAFRELRSCRDLGKFRAWVYRIAHNIGVNFWRKRNRERAWTTKLEDLAYEVASWAASPLEEATRKEEGLVVDEAMRELPAHYRSALLLFYYEEFSYQEMAEILGVPLSSVKTHLFRGRKLLENKLRHTLPALAGTTAIAYETALPSAAPVRTGA